MLIAPLPMSPDNDSMFDKASGLHSVSVRKRGPRTYLPFGTGGHYDMTPFTSVESSL